MLPHGHEDTQTLPPREDAHLRRRQPASVRDASSETIQFFLTLCPERMFFYLHDSVCRTLDKKI